jgi:ABC-type multidrug transport system fused ATPase/permease subunit
MIRRDDLRDLRLLLGRFARPYWTLIVTTGVFGIVVAALATLQPLLLAPALDLAGFQRATPAATWREVDLNNVGPTLLAWTRLGAAPWRIVLGAVVAYVTVVAVTSLAAFGNLLLVGRVRTHLFRDLQTAVYGHVLGLSMSYFVRQRAGDLGSRLTNDAFHAAQGVEAVLRTFLQAGAQLLFCSILLVRTDPRLTAGVLLVFAGHLLVTRLLRDRIRTLMIDQFDLFAELASRVHETMLSIRIVKSFGAERFEHGRFVERARHLGRVILKGGVFKYVENPLRDIADAIGLGLVLVLAFGALSQGRLTAAGLVLFVVLVRQALVPVSQMGAAALSLQTVIASSRRILAVLRERPAVVDGTKEAWPLREAVRLERVSFGYESGGEVVQDVTLEILRGEMVAVVGPSGAGKSTLADVLVRLYDPVDGRVTWDGVDVRDFRQQSYRQRFGVVCQEALLFNASVAENIAYGRPVERAAIVRAARIAHAESFIEGLPRGYETEVGDRGIRLSGGQRQRIAIARAVYGDPDVLLLDEATSALDSESEAQVQAAIESLAGHLTVVVIAHRLSTVARADRIVVLDKGRVEAAGTHGELLGVSPLYRRLCEGQFREPVDVGVEGGTGLPR